LPKELGDREDCKGRWVAWDRKKEEVLAIADDYRTLMEKITNKDDPDIIVDVAPGIHPEAACRPFVLLEDESPNIMDDIRLLIDDDPDWWLDRPHVLLNHRKPRDLIGAEDEKQVRYILRGIRSGAFS
jgi:hypothetical protein